MQVGPKLKIKNFTSGSAITACFSMTSSFSADLLSPGNVVVVEGQGGIFAVDVGHIVGPLNYSRRDTKHRLPCTITPFY